MAEFAMTMLPYERLDAGRETGPHSAKHPRRLELGEAVRDR